MLAAALFMAVGGTAQAQQANPWFTGDGGRGIRLAVLEPSSRGLSEEDQWMLSLVQGSITGDFNKFSGMTIVDRQNLERIIGEQVEYTSGKYSEADYIKIGNLANASHILTGSISKTPNSLIVEFAVTDLESGERKASYPPKHVSVIALENLSAIKEASADLLRQLGVNLTGAGLEELKRAGDAAKMQAGAMLARGIAAQKSGTEVTALSYFLQAAALDTTLLEAANRSSMLSVDISSGNIGDDTRNEIKWRKDWIARLTETETSFSKMTKNPDPPYTLFYSTDIERGEINYQKETTSFSFLVSLSANAVWFGSIQAAVQAVCDGINATGKKEVWGLSGWPGKGMSKTPPFSAGQQYSFSVVFEMVNERGVVIGKQTVSMETSFTFYMSRDERIMVDYPEDIIKKVTINAVNANKISDILTIRVASVNGANPENARMPIIALSDRTDTRRLSEGYEHLREKDRRAKEAKLERERRDREAKLERERWEKEAKLEKEREDKIAAQLKRERNRRKTTGGGLLLCVPIMLNEINPVYSTVGFGGNLTIEQHRGFPSFLSYGFDFEIGGVGVNENNFSRRHPYLNPDSITGVWLKPDLIAKIYFANTVFLSGGAGWWWSNLPKTNYREMVSAPVLSVGGGFNLGGGIIIEGQYSMLLRPELIENYRTQGFIDRPGGYYAVKFGFGGRGTTQ
jgi:TolB-like protein